MRGTLDHVGYLARDVEEAASRLGRMLGLEVSRRFARPQLALRGVYLGSAAPTVEVFAFTDAAVQAARLGGADLLLEHVAYAVDDIDATAVALRGDGVRFALPDGRPLDAPLDLDGVRHLWTAPATSGGVTLQLLQR